MLKAVGPVPVHSEPARNLARRPAMALIKRFLFESSGATAAEYALLLGILGAAIAVAAFSLGNNISNSLNATSETITDCGGGC